MALPNYGGLVRTAWDPQPSPTSGAGGNPYSYDPTYGGIPNLPTSVTDTTTQVGTDVQGEMIKNLPGYAGMSASDSANIQNNLSGQFSPDVLALMQQQSAERGVATGSPGSPNSAASYLRALGLTSQQLQQLGHTQLTQAMQRTPIQQTQTGTQTTDLSALRALYGAAPIPANAAAANRNALNQGLNQGAGAGGNYWAQQAAMMNSLAGTQSAPMSAGYGTSRTPLGPPGPAAPQASHWNWDPSVGGWVNGITGETSFDETPPSSSLVMSGPPPGPNAAYNTTAMANAMRGIGVPGEQDSSGYGVEDMSNPLFDYSMFSPDTGGYYQ